MDDPAKASFKCVARDVELSTLDGFLDEALGGKRSVCFVSGEAGAGKTALLAEFCRRARERFPDIVIADGTCDAQTGTGDAYLPFREILTELTGEVSEDSRAPGAPDPGTTRSTRWFKLATKTLVEHGPDLIDIFVPGGAVMTRLGAQAARGTRWAKRRGARNGSEFTADGIDQSHLCEQYTNVLRALAEEQALIVLVDDLHWADNASIDLLFHLSRRLVGDRVLVVGSYRPEDVAVGRNQDRHPLHATLNEIKRYHGDVDVAIGVGATKGMKFVSELIDSEPNRLDTAFREALYRHTDGHALFTVELLRELDEQGTLQKDDDGFWYVAGDLSWNDMPSRVEGVINERIARLDDEERQVLSVAAVIGETFSAEAVAETLGASVNDIVRSLSGPMSRQHRLVQALGVQRHGGERISLYEFRHSLFQRYLYQALDEIERVHLHDQVGRALEDVFRKDRNAVALQLARHFEVAEEVEKAVGYMIEAARQAYASHALRETQGHVERAFRLLDGVRDTDRDEAWYKEASLHLLRLLGQVQNMDCNYEAARESFEAALDLKSEDDFQGRAMLLCAIANTWESQSVYDKSLKLLDSALDVLGEEPDTAPAEWWREWLSVRIRQIWVSYWTGNSEAMLKLIEEVRPRVEQFGDATQKRRLWSGIAMLGYRKERFLLSKDTVAAADAALAASRDTDSLIEQADAMFGAGFARIFSDQSKEAIGYFIEGLELANKAGALQAGGRAATYLCVAYRQCGELEKLRTAIPRAETAIEASTAVEYRAVALANRSWLAWKEGDRQEAERLVEDALAAWREDAPRYPLQWLARLQLIAMSLDDGQVERAIGHARDLLGPPNALLRNHVTQRLERAVAAYEKGDSAAAASDLAEVVVRACDAGYL